MPAPGTRPPEPAYVELDAQHISEGKFLAAMNRRLRDAFKRLKEFEQEAGPGAGKVSVTGRVEIRRAKNLQEHYEVLFEVTAKTPTMKVGSVVKEKNGRLLCRPQGSAEDSPDQQLLFDAAGNQVGGIDPDTGEVYGPAPEGPIALQRPGMRSATLGESIDTGRPGKAGAAG